MSSKGLLDAKLISEAKYTKWLSNIVLVKKASRKWMMFVDYMNLNRAFLKDSYPLLNIDKLIHNSVGFKLLSFMNAYFKYNQISTFVPDRIKARFMIENVNYQYNVMPFGLKNVGAIYQRMMNKIFQKEIGETLEVYMDDMITYVSCKFTIVSSSKKIEPTKDV